MTCMFMCSESHPPNSRNNAPPKAPQRCEAACSQLGSGNAVATLPSATTISAQRAGPKKKHPSAAAAPPMLPHQLDSLLRHPDCTPKPARSWFAPQKSCSSPPEPIIGSSGLHAPSQTWTPSTRSHRHTSQRRSGSDPWKQQQTRRPVISSTVKHSLYERGKQHSPAAALPICLSESKGRPTYRPDGY